MIRFAALAVGAVLASAAAAAPLAHAAAPAGATTWKVAHINDGQPDLQGYWTNSSLTPETRAPGVTGLNYSPEEAAKREGAAATELKEGDKPLDPNAPPPKAGGDAPTAGTRAEFAAAGGAVGGYNTGWLDPGSKIMRVNGEPRTSILTTPDGKAPKSNTKAEIPLEYRNMAKRFDNVEWMSLGERCVMSFGRNAGPPMLANGFYNNDYRIIQTKDEVAIEIEMVHDVRHVRLNDTHHIPADVRPWMGDSIGRYEGDTLVVETTNFPEAMAYHGAWKDLKVTERFTRKGPGRLLYQFTVEAPSMWDKPWGGEYEFRPMNGIIYEYACSEGNYALEHMLAGAREEEKHAAASGKPAAKTGE